MLIGYAGASSDENDIYRQLDQLIGVGIDMRKIYRERSGDTVEDRPQLKKLIGEIVEGDVIVITELPKVCRNTKELFSLIDTIGQKKAFIKSLKESWLDTTSVSGGIIADMLSGISQFEKEVTCQRTRSVEASSRPRGRNGGRPKKTEKDIEEALKLYEEKQLSVREIEDLTGVSKATLYRYLKS